MGIFDPLKKSVAKPGSAADLAATLVKADTIETDLRAIIASLTPTRDDVMADDAARSKARLTIEGTQLQLADLAIFRVKLEDARNAALATEENERRQIAYAAAAEKVAKAGEFGKLYRKAATAMADAMRVLMEGKIACDVANTALPAGVVPLCDPELGFIRIPGEPRKILSEETVDIWCLAGSLTPAAIGHHKVTLDKSEKAGMANGIRVESRTFIRREVLTERYDVYSERVALKLAIPGWVAPPFVGWEGAFDAASYLAGINAAVAAQNIAPAPPTERQPQIELVPVTSNGEVREDQVLRGFQAQAVAAKAKAA